MGISRGCPEFSVSLAIAKVGRKRAARRGIRIIVEVRPPGGPARSSAAGILQRLKDSTLLRVYASRFRRVHRNRNGSSGEIFEGRSSMQLGMVIVLTLGRAAVWPSRKAKPFFRPGHLIPHALSDPPCAAPRSFRGAQRAAALRWRSSKDAKAAQPDSRAAATCQRSADRASVPAACLDEMDSARRKTSSRP